MAAAVAAAQATPPDGVGGVADEGSGVVPVVVVSPPTPAKKGIPEGVLLNSGSSVSFTWSKSDGTSKQWPINSDGTISGGTNSAYSYGMRLYVEASSFSASTSSSRVAPSGREIQVGPWVRNSVKVYRRITVSKDKGYCRYIDIFHNPTDKDIKVGLKYSSSLGSSVRDVVTTSGGSALTNKDWGIITGYRGDEARPAVGHVFASKGSQIRPTFAFSNGSSSVYCRYSMTIPAGDTVALCIFQMQVGWANADKVIKAFRPTRELIDVPVALRQIIVNMGGAYTVAGEVEFRRVDDADWIELAGGTDLRGELVAKQYVIATTSATMTIPAERVIGLVAAADGKVRALTTDGQVLTGKLAAETIGLRGDDGTIRQVPVKEVKKAAYALSKTRPADVAITHPLLVLIDGDRLAFDAGQVKWQFYTRHGRLTLDGPHLSELRLNVRGGLHKLTFQNGSAVSGLLETTRVQCPLLLGGKLDVPRRQVMQVVFPGKRATPAGLTRMTFRNETFLYGTITGTELRLRSDETERTVALKDIQGMELSPVGVGQAKITLGKDDVIQGELLDPTLTLRIADGIELDIHVGLLAKVEFDVATDATPATTSGNGSALPAGASPPVKLVPDPMEIRPRTMLRRAQAAKAEALAEEMVKRKAALDARRAAEAAKLQALAAKLHADRAAKAAKAADEAARAKEAIGKAEAKHLRDGT